VNRRHIEPLADWLLACAIGIALAVLAVRWLS
jgi:hypothetical protein